jgi:hypothetical protein
MKIIITLLSITFNRFNWNEASRLVIAILQKITNYVYFPTEFAGILLALILTVAVPFHS